MTQRRSSQDREAARSGARIKSPLGPLVLSATEEALTGLYLPDQNRTPHPSAAAGQRVLEQARSELDEYFAGARTRFTVPVAPEGTDFQRAVWAALLAIPYGETTSYGALAALLGCPGGKRAVGGAIGSNPIAIIVPCHRVIGADGGLRGYAGGVPVKRWLLEHEQARCAAQAALGFGLSPQPC